MTTVVRWRRYGKDRLYVTAEDGTKLGFHDLATGIDHVEVVQRAAELRSAVEAWTGPGMAEAPPPPPSVPRQRSEPVAETPWEDLATHRPGAMAREVAVELQQEAPVRTFLARVLGVHTDERAWRIGAKGEEKVAAQLERLAEKDPRWHFLHAIAVGSNGADIDHFVVGPGGAFTLNAKHHPGGNVWVGGNVLMVNGKRYPYIRNSRHEAQRATRLLSAACGFRVAVTGLVVPVGAGDVTIRRAPEDVHVVPRMSLVRWLSSRPQVMDAVASAAIFDAARRSTTWTG